MVRSYSFGHLDSVKWITLNWPSLFYMRSWDCISSQKNIASQIVQVLVGIVEFPLQDFLPKIKGVKWVERMVKSQGVDLVHCVCVCVCVSVCVSRMMEIQDGLQCLLIFQTIIKNTQKEIKKKTFVSKSLVNQKELQRLLLSTFSRPIERPF